MRLSLPRPTAEGGFSVVEAAVSAFVLVVAVAGLVASLVQGRALERSTDRMWRATADATTALEDIRAESRTRWSSIPAWDARSVGKVGGSAAAQARIEAKVSDDASDLDDAAGMWSAGATAPNFYHVSVGGAGDGEFGATLRFQTYVADRSGLRTGDPAGGARGGGPSGGSPGGGDPPAGGGSPPTQTSPVDDASSLSTAPTDVVLSGSSRDTLTFRVSNTSADDIVVASVKVTIDGGSRYSKVSMGAASLYDKPSKPKNGVTFKPCGAEGAVPAGPLEFRVVGVADRTEPEALAGHVVTLAFTFGDGSKSTVTVRP